MSLTIKELGSDFRLAIKLQWGMCPYDPEGLRVVKKAKGETTHYVFQGTEPIFEKRINAGKAKSYVYALGKYLARVDGVIGDPEAKKYFYHTDHAGSIRVITDQAGEVVYKADYFAFGTQFVKDGEFEELHGFTGKEYDPDIGLYYFNARWYDPDLGRFISEDPAGQGPNPYSYCGNNPLNRVDPTGKVWWWLVSAIISGLDSYLCGGDFLQGFCIGAFTGAMGYGINAFVGQAWGATLGAVGTRAVSGAIAGGIMGEISGQGAIKGAVYGAVGGAISYEMDMRYGDFADKNWFNKALIGGLSGGLNAFVQGGDFVEAFAYGFEGTIRGTISWDQRIKNAMDATTKPGIRIEGPPDFIEDVKTYIQRLTDDQIEISKEGYIQILKENSGGTKTAGTKLIRDLVNGGPDKTFSVAIIPGTLSICVDYVFVKLPVKGRVIEFNRSQTLGSSKVDHGGTSPQIVLAHELIHSWHYMKGDFDYSFKKDWHGAKGWDQQAIGWGKYKNEPITENVIRKEQPDNNTRLWY